MTRAATSAAAAAHSVPCDALVAQECHGTPFGAERQTFRFSACGNTKAKMEQKSGKMVTLVEGVEVVQAGVLRIMQLQEQGYAYVRP